MKAVIVIGRSFFVTGLQGVSWNVVSISTMVTILVIGGFGIFVMFKVELKPIDIDHHQEANNRHEFSKRVR